MTDSKEIRALTDEEEGARLAALRLAQRLSDSQALTAEHVQALYDALLIEDPRPPQMEIALGIAFGQLIVDSADFEWVRVTDAHGSETSLAPRGFDASCHPISMIQKRLASGAELDVAELKADVVRVVEQRVADGLCAHRQGS